MFGLVEKYGGGELVLGSAEIRVFGSNGVTYAAPDMIYHYVAEHEYKPPDEFIEAVLYGPLPDTVEYKVLLAKCLRRLPSS